jgi:hypothetical protein
MNIDAIQISGGEVQGGLTGLSDAELIDHVISEVGHEASSEEINEVVRKLIVRSQG